MISGRRLVFLAALSVTAAAGCKDRDLGRGGVVLPPGGVQVIADDHGFNPSSVTLRKGQPGALVFVRTSDETCATEVVFPELNITRELPKGKPVTIDIPTDNDRTLTFQCGMGMYKSAVVIH